MVPPTSSSPPLLRLVVGVTVPVTTRLMQGQLAWLRAFGYDVHVISSPGPDLDRVTAAEGVTAHALPMEREVAPAADLRALFRAVILLRRIRPEVTSVGTPKAGLVLGLAAFATRVPNRVYILRGLRMEGASGVRRTLLKVLERVACRAAHVVVCVSPSLRDLVVAEGIVPAAKTRVIGNGSSNGVDLTRFAATPERVAAARALRQDRGIAPDDLVIGFAGRLTHDKGLRELLAASTLLSERGVRHVLLVAGPAEGFDVTDFPGVQVLGSVEDMAPCYAAMDVLALPTYREGFPNVVLEAAAAGVPAVVSSATGAVDAVVEGVTGRLVPVRDVGALAEALGELLTSPHLRTRMGAAARARVVSDFAPLRVWQGLDEVFRHRGGRSASTAGAPS